MSRAFVGSLSEYIAEPPYSYGSKILRLVCNKLRATICIYTVRYEWEERKNQQNRRKHGVSFEMAALAFEDPRCLISFDREDESGELRWHALGSISIECGVSAVLLVVHALWGG